MRHGWRRWSESWPSGPIASECLLPVSSAGPAERRRGRTRPRRRTTSAHEGAHRDPCRAEPWGSSRRSRSADRGRLTKGLRWLGGAPGRPGVHRRHSASRLPSGFQLDAEDAVRGRNCPGCREAPDSRRAGATSSPRYSRNRNHIIRGRVTLFPSFPGPLRHSAKG